MGGFQHFGFGRGKWEVPVRHSSGDVKGTVENYELKIKSLESLVLGWCFKS